MSVASKARALATDEQAAAHVLMFSKTHCPFCVMAKDLFAKHKVKVAVVELNTMPNGSDIQNKLATITGQRTVPNIFIGDEHVGGCDEAQMLDARGKLAEMLKQ
ncbi:Glutaredoxin [Diplonema papillatum]|nr:Glutaredoxin [Diplonema papillatum]